MPTKRQHYVPRVYIKAWETEVETIEEPNKKFKGLYVFENSDIGQGKNKNRSFSEYTKRALGEIQHHLRIGKVNKKRTPDRVRVKIRRRRSVLYLKL